MGLERLAPASGDPTGPGRGSEPDVPFGVSAEAFLAARGIAPEPLAAPEPRRSRRRPARPEVVDLTEVDEGAPLPGRFQGPAAARQVGGAKKKGPKTWPTREERDARQVERAEDRAAQVAADPVGVARDVCLRQLEVGPRTRAELARKLAAHGVPEEAAEEVLGRFAEVGIIDDALFASMWVTSRHRGRGLAGRALSQELRRKGVDDETVRTAVDALDPEQEAATARALVRKKLPSSRGLAPEARVRRLVGMLARKGYGGGLAFRVVKEELDREGTDTEGLHLDTDGLSALE
jgi:regulatory protein